MDLRESSFDGHIEDSIGIDHTFIDTKDLGRHRGVKPILTEALKKIYDKLLKKVTITPSKIVENMNQLQDSDVVEEDILNVFDVATTRAILYEGKVTKRYNATGTFSLGSSTKKKYIVLLNDFLLICDVYDKGIVTSSESYDVQYIIPLDKISIVDLHNVSPLIDDTIDASNGLTGFQIHVNSSYKRFTFLLDNETDKNIWLEELELAILAVLSDNASAAALTGVSHTSSTTIMLPKIILGTVHSAAYTGDIELLKMLVLRSTSSISNTSIDGTGANDTCTESRNILDVPDESGMFPMHWAALSGHKHIVVYLVENDCSVDCLNNGLNSPLLIAAAKGYDDIVSFLIRSCADITIRNLKDRNALSMVVLHSPNSKGIYTIIKDLIDNGLDIHATDAYGSTPLHVCAARNEHRPIQILVDIGANVNATHQRNGLTALHMACANPTPDPETVRSFLDKGGYANWKDASGRTALDMLLATQKSKSIITDNTAIPIGSESSGYAYSMDVSNSKKSEYSNSVIDFSTSALPIIVELVRKGARYDSESLSHLRKSFQEAIDDSRLSWTNMPLPEYLLEFLYSDEASIQLQKWTKNSSSKSCLLCHDKFTMVDNRRHHCRVCGLLICANCSSKRLPISQLQVNQSKKQQYAESPRTPRATSPSSTQSLSSPSTPTSGSHTDDRVCDACFNIIMYSCKEWKQNQTRLNKDRQAAILKIGTPSTTGVDSPPKPPSQTPTHTTSGMINQTNSTMSDTLIVMGDNAAKLQEISERTENMKVAATDYNRMTKSLLEQTKQQNTWY